MTATASPPRPTVAPPPAKPVRHHARPRRSGWTALLAVIPALAMAAAGWYGAGSREMWEDEYATYHAITLSWADLGRLFSHMDLVHALYYVAMRGWLAVTGDSLLMLRVPSIAAMAVTVGVTALIGRRLAGAPVGVVGGLLLVVIPSMSRYAQEVRSYALVTMLATLATYLLLRALDRPTGPRFTLYAGATALAGLTHFVALAVLGGHLLYVWLASRATDERRRWGSAGAIGAALLVVVPLPALASNQSGAVSWLAAEGGALTAFPGKLLLSADLAYALFPLALLGGLVLWRRNRSGAALLLGSSLGPVAFVWLTLPFLHLLVARYLLFTLPAFALLAAAAVCFLFRPLGSRPHGVAWTVGAALALPALSYLAVPDQRDVRLSPVQGQPGYRSALTWLQSKAEPGDGIVYNDRLGGRNDLARAAAEYELRDGAPRDVLLARTAAQRGYFGAQECPDVAPCLSGRNRLWLLSTGTKPEPWDGMVPVAAAILGEDFTVAAQKGFPRIRVVLLVRRTT